VIASALVCAARRPHLLAEGGAAGERVGDLAEGAWIAFS
jgi:hypothetical protein